MSNYENLDAWKLSMELVTEVYVLMKRYPKDETFGLISQSKRAAVSVPSNIAEGLGRRHKKDTLQFLHISRGSLYELETLLNVAVRVGILNDDDLLKVNSLLQQSLKLVNGLIKYYSKAKTK